MKRYAFTMIELVFVIVIMGIIGKFGVEFLANAYKSFIYAKENHTLQSNSQTAINLIATRLEHRIKDSIIARQATGNPTDFVALGDASGNSYSILEWVGSDIDGLRGLDVNASWSGINDIDAGTSTLIVSPGTDTNNVDDVITAVSTSSINNAALYFVGSNSDITLDYGWSGNTSYIEDHNGSMHPIQAGAQPTHFVPKVAGNTFKDVYEYYKLAWTAYAIVHSADGNLTLHYDYQPWDGEKYDDAGTKKSLIMNNVDTFQFMAIGSLVKIQVCVESDIIDGSSNELDDGGYSLCKEKTIY